VIGGGIVGALLVAAVNLALLQAPSAEAPAERRLPEPDDADDMWRPHGTEPSPSDMPTPTIRAGRPFFLVVSPESSGNRYLVQLLVAAGCRGRSGHRQPFDAPQRFGRSWPHRIDAAAAADAPCAVVHRSMPHGGVWPNVTQLAADVRAAGWLPHVLVLVRADQAVAASQVAARHVASLEMAAARIGGARLAIVRALGQDAAPTFDFVLYEQLGRAEYTDWLFGRLGRPLPPTAPAFVDANAKYSKH